MKEFHIVRDLILDARHLRNILKNPRKHLEAKYLSRSYLI